MNKSIPPTGFEDKGEYLRTVEDNLVNPDDRIVLDDIRTYDPYNPSKLKQPFGRFKQKKYVKVITV